ncbi:hypothetical protein [Telmatocola sphagniphila]|uniref:hypothetical protein n=1 Tax=Telmatocola sphagniphila TaxID=1123043 RepID=UPI001FE9470C|nr:hypothetical protein [Telmatocola sphagniphila]
MTEEEWINSPDWQPLIQYLSGSPHFRERKVNLYICAGLRVNWNLLYSNFSREAVEVAERAADGRATEKEIHDTQWAAECPTFGFDFDPEFIRNHSYNKSNNTEVKRLIEMGVFKEEDIQGNNPLGEKKIVDQLSNLAHIAYHLPYESKNNNFSDHLLDHLQRQEEWPGDWLVREIFGNPFHPVTFDPRWQTTTVTDLARSIYATRGFDQMPILADALEDAGCDNQEILTHCRGDGSHVKGCWVVDLILGKE